MKKFIIVIGWALMLIANADAFDVKLLSNNKEAFSRELSKEAIQQATQWSSKHHLKNEDLRLRAVKALATTFNEMEKIDTTCELGLIKQLQSDARKNEVIVQDDDIHSFIGYLRQQDLIDDVLYKLMRDSAKLKADFIEKADDRPARPFNVYTRQNAGVDIEKMYAPLKNWPDDVRNCTLHTYFDVVNSITFKNAKDRDGQMSKLNYIAYVNGVIDLDKYNRLMSLQERGVYDWPVYFRRYADIINNAKDKLTKNPEAKATHNFTVEYVSKRDKLTQRGNLYRTYNSTQVMMLAQIIEKTAKRMDARNVSINWQYTDDPNGEREIYVLSPMEQYRAAIKMLRKDMAEVMRSDAFRGTGLEYDHLIAAAFEAGFIKSHELDQVLKFEDFWNPKTPKWKAYANFAFSLAGTATFYLPPPWNIIGAIGLVLTQTKLVNGDQAPDADENWNVII
jgi:hypothetical protein